MMWTGGKILYYYCLMASIYCFISIIGLLYAGKVLLIPLFIILGIANSVCYLLVKKAESKRRPKLRVIG